jgi:hypothetical protein
MMGSPADQRRHLMDLPDAPIALDGFFAAHFFTVKDQEYTQVAIDWFNSHS